MNVKGIIMESYKIKILAGLFIFGSGVMFFPIMVWMHPYLISSREPWTTPVKISMDEKLVDDTNIDVSDVVFPSIEEPRRDVKQTYTQIVFPEDGFIRPVPKWNANLPVTKRCTSSDLELQCLACALYFEARGETSQIQYLVGQVILNRVKSRDYPNTICGVVWQRKQFSWTNDGLRDVMRSDKTRERVVSVARAVLRDDDYGTSRIYNRLPENACWYHDQSLKSTYWSKKMTLVKKFGPFYVYKGKACRKQKKNVYRSSKSIKPDTGKGYILLRAAVSPRL